MRNPGAGTAAAILFLFTLSLLPARADLLGAAGADKGWDRYDDLAAALQAQKGEVNTARDGQGRTALHLAARNHANYGVGLLLLAGADPNARDAQGYTPLLYAIQAGEPFSSRYLILRGADLNAAANDGTTALGLAVQADNATLAEMLLWLGAAPTPAQLALAQGKPDLLSLLQFYQKGDGPAPTRAASPQAIPKFVQDALQTAARRADYDSLQALLASGADINAKDSGGFTALHRAIRAGQCDVALYLLLLGADPAIPGGPQERTSLMQTMGWFGADFDALRVYLLLKGAKPAASCPDDYTEVTYAAERGSVQGLTWLGWLGQDFRQRGSHGTPLEIAFNAGNQSVIDFLRKHGVADALPLRTDPVWNLNNAAQRGDDALIKEILGNGVAVDAADEKGNSPLMNAISHLNVDTARLLVSKGAAINYVNPKSGWTPLFMSVIWDRGDITDFREELLKAGANPNVVDKGGLPLLDRSLWHFPTTPMKQLVAHGADLTLRDAQGRTPVTRALQDGNTSTAEYLKQMGGKE